LNQILWLLSRLCIGSLFVAGAVDHWVAFVSIAQQLSKRGLPWPRALLVVGSVWQAVTGVLLIVGIHVYYAALALVVFTIFASIMLLDFWNRQGTERTSMLTSWRLNIAVIGGLLAVMTFAGSAP
jgi:putative oxidoreductase